MYLQGFTNFAGTPHSPPPRAGTNWQQLRDLGSDKAFVVALKSHNHKQSGLQSIYARPGNTVLQALGCFAVDMTPPFLRVHNGGKDLRFRLFGVTSGSQIQAEYVSTKPTASTSYKPSTPNHLKYDRSSYIPKTRQVAWGRLRRSPLPVPAGKASGRSSARNQN